MGGANISALLRKITYLLFICACLSWIFLIKGNLQSFFQEAAYHNYALPPSPSSHTHWASRATCKVLNTRQHCSRETWFHRADTFHCLSKPLSDLFNSVYDKTMQIFTTYTFETFSWEINGNCTNFYKKLWLILGKILNYVLLIKRHSPSWLSAHSCTAKTILGGQ
jgi:hypothetical protein